jgi:coproporphyrinogen III oxidase-like Fe-S oxidoreductase
MVGIGIQSFQQKELITLGREFIDSDEKVTIIKNVNFKVIDVDLIFGIHGQSIEDLKKDFITNKEIF